MPQVEELHRPSLSELPNAIGAGAVRPHRAGESLETRVASNRVEQRVYRDTDNVWGIATERQFAIFTSTRRVIAR
jgi:hypothetical protein